MALVGAKLPGARKVVAGIILLSMVVLNKHQGFASPARMARSNQLPDDMRPANTDLWDLAETAYAELINSKKVAACSELVPAIAKEDPVLGAVWLHEIRLLKASPSASCYEAVIESESREGLATQASAALDATNTVSAGAYCNVIEALARCGDVDAVRTCIAGMKASGVNFDRHLPKAIEAFAKHGDSSLTKQLLDEAIHSGASIDAHTFTAAISVFAKEGNFAQAEEVFELMQNHSVAPDADAWAWLLLASATDTRMRRQTNPEQIFRGMLDHGVVPTTFNFRALGRAIGTQRSVQLCKELGLASRFAGRVRRSTPKQRRFHIRKRPYVDGYSQPGDWEDRTGEEKVWLGDDSMVWVDPFPKYFSFSPIFKPDKDHGTRRHRKPNLPSEEAKT